MFVAVMLDRVMVRSDDASFVRDSRYFRHPGQFHQAAAGYSGCVRGTELGMALWIHYHRQHDVELLFVESENDLHPGNLVSSAEFNGLSRTQKIHGFAAVTGRN